MTLTFHADKCEEKNIKNNKSKILVFFIFDQAPQCELDIPVQFFFRFPQKIFQSNYILPATKSNYILFIFDYSVLHFQSFLNFPYQENRFYS